MNQYQYIKISLKFIRKLYIPNIYIYIYIHIYIYTYIHTDFVIYVNDT